MNEYEQNIEIMKDLRARLDKVLESNPKKEINIPDPKKHQTISFIKSGFRIIAGAAIVAAGYTIHTESWLIAGGILLIGAEFLGIVEELV